MKLFLQGGGGGRKDSTELDKKFVASLDLSKPLLYIPIAIEVDRYPYPACFAWISDLFKPLGVNTITMWIEKDLQHKTEKDFEQFSGIYIGGGNTFKLLKGLKEFGTFTILKKLAAKGVPIYGGSAGAIILAQTIIPAFHGDKNEVNLNDFSALALVKDYNVWCHFVTSDNAILVKYMEKYNLNKIIAIPEAAGIFVTETQIEAVGPANVTVFEDNTSRTLHPGERKYF